VLIACSRALDCNGLEKRRQKNLTSGFGRSHEAVEFLMGKFTGLVLTLTVNTAAMAAGFFGDVVCENSLVSGDTVALWCFLYC